MKIDRVHIEGFGALSQIRYALQPGLNLLEGANEAGKSTLLAFIRAVLFGFSRKGTAARYEVEEGAPFGGELWLSTPQGPLIVRRVRGRRSEGLLTLRGADGSPQPVQRLDEVLHGVSQQLFEQVFAFSLSELATFDALAQEGSVSEALFAAGFDGARRLPRVKQALETAAEGIFKGSGAKQPLNVVLQALAQLRAERQAFGDQPAAYQRCVDRLRAIESSLEELGKQLREREQAHRVMLGLHHASADLVAWARLRASLSTFDPDLARHPLDALQRLEAERARRDESMARLAQIAVMLERAVESRKKWDSDLLPPQHVQTVRLAHARLAGWTQNARSLSARRSTLEAERRGLEAEVAGIDEGMLRRLETLDVGAAARAAWSTCSAALHDQARQVAACAAELQQRAERCDELEARARALAEGTAGLCAIPVATLVQAQRQAQSLMALHREASGLGDARTELQKELELRRDDPEPAPRPPPASVLAWAAPVLALTVALAALVQGDLKMGSVAGVLSILMLAASVVHRRRVLQIFAEASRAHTARASDRARHVQLLTQRLQALEGRLQAVTLERGRLAAHLEAVVRPSLSESAASIAGEAYVERIDQLLLQAHRRETLEQEQDALGSQIERSRRELEAAEARARAVASRYAEAREAAAAFLVARGLPESLAPDAATALFSELARLQQVQRTLSHRAQVLADEEEAIRAAREALERACGATGRPLEAVGAVDVEALVAHAHRLLVAHDRALEQIAVDDARVADLEAQQAGEAATRESAQARIDALLKATGAPDEARFRERAAQAQVREGVRTQLEIHRVGIERAARCAAEMAHASWEAAGGGDGVAARVAELEGDLEALRAEVARLSEEKGAVLGERDRLATDGRLAELRLEEEQLAARAQTLAQAYARERLGLQLLSRARQRYEEAQQPALLRSTAAVFSALTDGRYGNVLASPDDASELQVVSTTRGHVSADRLSRGTREQLYLAFRLAVLEDFSLRKGPLPIVLDDVWVNFDPERAQRAVAVLAQRARAQQVIAFTCHPWVRGLFEAAGAHIIPAAVTTVRASA